MANTTDCERYLIEKLISILSKTLSCQNGGGGETDSVDGGKGVESEGISESESSVAQKLLRILISQSDAYFGPNGTFLEVGIASQDANSQNVTFLSGDDAGPSSTITGGGIPSPPNMDISSNTPTDGNSFTMSNKLHKLELIKVFVLIFVISIILLTTCRMIFQLFIRFRPEKPPLG